MQRLHITPVVLNLLIINALVFVALNVFPDLQGYFVLAKLNLFGLHEEYTQLGVTYYTVYKDGEMFLGPEAGQFLPLQIVTHFFSHTAVWHIFMNMFALFNFGPMLEMVMGARRFIIAYLTIGVLSGLMVAFLDPSPFSVIGASGVLFGLTVIYGHYFPNARLSLMFLPFQFGIRGFLIVAAVISAGLVAAEYVTGSSMGGISHFGHLSGMVAGFLYLRLGGLRKMVKK